MSAAVEWYQQQAGLGVDLLAAVRGAVTRIARRPASFPAVVGVPSKLGVRRYTMKAFPFALVFVELPEELHVIAFAHLKRRPGYWRARVREFK